MISLKRSIRMDVLAKCLNKTTTSYCLRFVFRSKTDHQIHSKIAIRNLSILTAFNSIPKKINKLSIDKNYGFATSLSKSRDFEHSLSQENIAILQEILSGASFFNLTSEFGSFHKAFLRSEIFDSFFILDSEDKVKLSEPFRLYLIDNQRLLIRLIGWILNNPIVTIKSPYSHEDSTNIHNINENYLNIFEQLTYCLDETSHTVQNYLYISRSIFDSQNHFRSPLFHLTELKILPKLIDWLKQFPKSPSFHIRLQDGPKDCIDTILTLKSLGLQISSDDLKACLEIYEHYGISQKDQVALQGLYLETQTNNHPLDKYKEIDIRPDTLIKGDTYLEIFNLLLRHRSNQLFKEKSILLLNYYSQSYSKPSAQELLSFNQVTKLTDELLNIKKDDLSQIIEKINLNGISKLLWLQLNTYNSRLTIPQITSLSLATILFHYNEQLPNSISDWASFRGRFLKFLTYNFEGIFKLSTPRTLSLLFNTFNYITNKQEPIFLLGKASLHCEYLQLSSIIKKCIESISHNHFEFLINISHLDPNEYLQLIAGFMKYEVESSKLLDILVDGFISQHSKKPVVLEVENITQILENLKDNCNLPYNLLDLIIQYISDDSGLKKYNAHEALQLSYNLHHLVSKIRYKSKKNEIFRSLYNTTNLRDFDSTQISQFITQFKRISQNPMTPETNILACYILLENIPYLHKEAIIEVIDFLLSTHTVLNCIKYGPRSTFTPFRCIAPSLIKYLRDYSLHFTSSEYLKIGRFLNEINEFSEIFKALIKQSFYNNHHLLNNALFLKFVLMTCNNDCIESQIMEIFKQRCSKMKTLEIQEYEDFLSCLNFLNNKTKIEILPSLRLIDINNLPLTSLLDHLAILSLNQEIGVIPQSPQINNYLKCLKAKLQDTRHSQSLSQQDYSNLSNIIHFLGKSEKYDIEFLDSSIMEAANKHWLSNQESKRLEFLFSPELDRILAQLLNEPRENFGRLVDGNFIHYTIPNERKAIILATLSNKKTVATNPKEYITSSFPFDQAKIVAHRLRKEGWTVQYAFGLHQFENNIKNINTDKMSNEERETHFQNINSA